MLCKCCQRIQDLDFVLKETIINHHESFAALVQAGNDGCELCTSLIQAFERDHHHDHWLRIIGSPKEYEAKAPKGQTQITWTFSGLSQPYWSIAQKGFREGFKAFFEPFTNPNDPLSAIVIGRPIQKDVGSEECFNMIKTWMAICQKDHPACNPPPHYLPSRVLDVRSPGEDPRLHLSSPSDVSPWVTLSHCWGGQSPLTTTLGSLQNHCNSIPMGSFPLVFRDAIQLTRSLGFKYLWIDSLCIIQDSHADWAIESTKMHHIYSGATLCIAASAARNSSEGIFARGNLLRHRLRALVTIPCYSLITYKTKGLVSFREVTPEGIGREVTNLWEEPLHKRAWVLQESVLSPRRIDFGSLKLHWACRQSRLSEAFPEISELIDPFFMSGKDLYSMPVTLTPLSSYPSITSRRRLDSPMEWWYGALVRFASRNITNRGDLLPAIAGIAIIVKERTGYNYLCGLWKEDIYRGLLWVSRRKASRVKDDPVPSWSWASLNIPQNHVQLDLEQYEPGHRTEITEYRIETLRNMEFAPVLRAELTIRGSYLALTFSTWKYSSAGRGSRSNTMHLVAYNSAHSETAHKIVCHLDEEDVSRMFYEELVEREVICLQIAMFSADRWKEKIIKEETVFGLLLEPTDRAVGAYRRIGVVEIPKLGGLADGWMERSVRIV